VLITGDECRPGRPTPARVAETFQLTFHREEDLPPGCWRGGRAEAACHPPQGVRDCFRPPCPCGDCLPIARLRLDGSRRLAIDVDGVPRVAGAACTLTRVVATS
jgi:hypothetical protein